MKIAFATDDGHTISAHFGRARYYYIVEVQEQNDNQSQGELVDKVGHHSPYHGPLAFHDAMFAPLEGCDLLVARGMGEGALMNAEARGLRVILTDYHTIPEAVAAWYRGELEHNPRRVHQHHQHSHHHH